MDADIPTPGNTSATDPSDTQKIYKQLPELQAKYDAEFQQMMAAARVLDFDAMKKHFDKCREIENEQSVVSAQLRQHLVNNARAKEERLQL